jgi:L-ascorbate metabolism protein UlaG (beta-lactamase superfamily)
VDARSDSVLRLRQKSYSEEIYVQHRVRKNRFMRRCIGYAACAVVVSLLALPAILHADKSNRQSDLVQTSRGELRIMPVYHGSVMLEFDGKVIHIDPWSHGDYTDLPKADLIVITHTHGDHLDRPMIDQLKKPATVIVGPPAVIDTLNCAPACAEVEAVSDSEQKTVMGIKFEGVAMYNLVTGSAPGKPFHHKGVGSGYVLNFGDTRVYFSGDTECVPEVKALKNITVAFLAMSASRTESPADAAACVMAFKPKIVYPYHYRGSNPQEFADAVKGSGIDVRLRKLEGEP